MIKLGLNIKADITCKTWAELWSYIRRLNMLNESYSVELKSTITQKMLNAMSYFHAIGIDFSWYFQNSILKNGQALETAYHFSTEQSIQRQLADMRQEVGYLIHEYAIKSEVIENIDVYMIMCREYQIEIGASMVLVEKKTVFAPTTLQAKQLNINPDYACVRNGKCKYTYISTLLDKLKAYLELKWVLELSAEDTDKLNADQNYTTLTQLTQACVTDTLARCGRDYTVPLSACEAPDNFDSARLEKLLY